MHIVEPAVILIRAYWPAIVAVAILGRLAYNRYAHGLRSVPGPFLASCTDLWRLVICLQRTTHREAQELHRKHNSTFVRTGPRSVSVGDPALIPAIYNHNAGFSKTKLYEVFLTPYEGEYIASLFNTRDEKYHATIRRPIANAYAMTTAMEFEPLVNSTTEVLMQRFDEFAESGEFFDLGRWLQMWSFDVIGEISFSKRLGFLDTSSDVEGIIADIRSKVYLGSVIGQIPEIDRFLKNPLLLAILGTHPIAKFTVARMNEREKRAKAGEDMSRDFLARCYEAQAKFPSIVTDGLIRTYNIDNVTAGSDTTVTVLNSVLYYLMKSPEAMERVVAEANKLSSSTLVTWKEANAMTYLHAAIKEAMRIHPPAGLMVERHVTSQGIELRGHFFPPGTILGVNAWVTTRDTAVFGDDVETFRPERWLDATDEQRKLMERANFTFGAGAHTCIGQNIAMLEITKIVPQLLRRYEFEFPTPDHEWTLEASFIVYQNDFKVRLRRREIL